MSTSKLADARRAAEQALTALRDLVAVHQRFEREPLPGSVIRFTKRYTTGGKGYTFAALRIGVRWYLTGARSSSSGRPGGWMTFEELVEFIGDSKTWVSGDWTEVPTLNPEIPAEDNAELLARVTDLLSKGGGKDVGEVAKDLLKIFRVDGEQDSPESFVQRETATGARFHSARIFDDKI